MEPDSADSQLYRNPKVDLLNPSPTDDEWNPKLEERMSLAGRFFRTNLLVSFPSTIST